MIGLDTNVLLRLLVRDNLPQYEAAARFVREAVAQRETLFINRIVVVELAWALARSYRRSRDEIATAIEQILMTAEFEVEGSTLAWAALHEYQRSKADFSDCLISAVNKDADCTTTVTFDRQAGKIKTFKLL